MDAAARTTDTPRTPRSRPSKCSKNTRANTPAAWCSSKPAKRVAATTCRRTWTRWLIASARPRWWSASTRAAATTTNCGGTTSLRGIVVGTLYVDILREGVHSGDASGVVPSSFRIARDLLTRLEDPSTGRITATEFHAAIPEDRLRQATLAGNALGTEVWDKFSFVEGAGPVATNPAQMIVARTWESALSVTGVAGMPGLDQAGNVLRPGTALKLSLRVPPTLDSAEAAAALKALLEDSPPYGASVRFEVDMPGDGWNAPALAPWLDAGDRRRIPDLLRQARCAHGRGRVDPFHGHAGRQVPASTVLDHGRAGAGIQRPWPERVPAHPDRQAAHGVRGFHLGCPRPSLAGVSGRDGRVYP